MVLLALGAGGYLYLQLDNEICRCAQNVLSEHYPHLNATVGSARYMPGRGVSLFDVRLSRPDAAEAQLDIGELLLLGDFDLQHLVTGEHKLQRIEVRQPRIRATRDAHGRWDIEDLWPANPATTTTMPPVRITNATVLVDQSQAPSQAVAVNEPLTIRNLELTLTSGDGETCPAGDIAFHGSTVDSIAKSLRIDGAYSPATGSVHCMVEAARLRVTNDLLSTLPGFDNTILAGLKLNLVTGGKAVLTLPNTEAPLEWSGDLEIVEGGIQHPLLPRPLTELTASAHLAHNRVQVDKLTAQFGGAELSLAGNRRGWTLDSPAAVTWRMIGLALDEKLYHNLPPTLRSLWNRFRPTGMVDSTGSATFDGRLWKPDATLTCRGVAFEDHEQFPYRLTDATGALRFWNQGDPNTGGRLDVNLLAQGEGRPIRLTGGFRHLPCTAEHGGAVNEKLFSPCPVGWVAIEADTLRVTEKLLAALPPDAQHVARSLQPSGTFAAKWRMERPSTETPVQTRTTLTARDCSAEYKEFPYRLTNVVGQLHEQNGRWWFENVTARGGGGQVLQGTGVLDPPLPGSTAPPQFRMRVTGGALSLDTAVRDALPSSAQQAWHAIRPRGRINFTADVFCQGYQEPRIDLVMSPHERDLAIEPKSFPYRLEGIDGKFYFNEGRLTFQSARAHHGRTQIEGDGLWTETPGGGWRLDVSSLAVDRLDADHDFRLAAPIDLRRVMRRLDPKGAFGVHNGRITIIKPDDPAAPTGAEWDLEFDFHQADLSGGLMIEDASGSVRLAGRSQDGKTFTAGELNVDTLFWNGLQLTNVRGPMWCDETQCLLGAAAVAKLQPNQPTTQARQVTSQLYGGTASLSAQVLFGEQPRYGAAVSFRDVDLERFTGEYGHAKTPLAGKMDGTLELQGLGTTVYGLGGTGEVNIREADFGQPTVLVSLLKVLRTRAPGTTAFDRCNAHFRIQGEHINFEQLDLLGDAINLYGVGEARIDRSLDLSFRTIVGRSGVNAPFLRSLVGQASEQLLTIRVGGTLDAPQVQPETLPLVGNVLRQFQQNPNGGDTGVPSTPPARRY